MVLGSTSKANVEGLVRIRCSSSTVNRMGISLRCNGSTTFYMGRISANANTFAISKVVAGTTTDLFSTAFTPTLNSYYWIKFRAIGTKLEAKVWADGSGEPGPWTVSGTDSSISAAGTFGVTLNSSSGAATFDMDTLSFNDGTSTQTAQTRLLLSVQSTKTAQTRTRLQVLRTLTAQSRTRLRVLNTLTAQVRARLQVQSTKTAQARTRLRVLRTLTAQVRMVLSAGTTASKTAQVRARLRVLRTLTAQTRVRLQILNTKTAQIRLKLALLSTKTAQARLRLRVTATRTAQTRVRLQVLRTLTAQVRSVLRVTSTKTAQVRLRLPAIRTMTAQMRLILSGIAVTKTAQVRTRLQVRNTKTAQARLLLAPTRTRTAQARFRLASVVQSKTAQVRARLRVTGTKTAQVRFVMITASILSGGFTVFANGTGTASIDHFRVVEYPDPALSLAPIVPRLGFSSVSWNSQLATNTTLGVDASLDGVNWTDISAYNGLTLPLLTSQPAFVIDNFATNTNLNYTSTFRTGGAAATWTIDTANSRLISVAGTNALYISNRVTRADVDLYVDMNRSDTGGIVWRYSDQNNFYFATFTDSISTSTQQTITINRVAANVLTVLATASISFQRTLVTRCRISMLASLITASVDGVVVATYTDGSPLSGAAIGIYSNGGTNYCTQLWIQPQGDYVTGTPPLDTVTGDFVYTRQRLATTDPSVTPYVLDFTISTANPDISQGTLIPSIDYDHALVSANFDDLAKQSNFSWYVNNREVIFRLPGAVPSPWVIQSAAGGLTSWIEPDSNLIVTQANNALYRNRQILTGVIGTGTFSNTFVGDGNSTSFTLSYPVASGTIPTITLDGVAQTVALKGTAGSQWYYAEGDLVIAQDASGTVITAIDTLVVSPYVGTFTMTVIVDNTTAQAALALVEGASGIVEEVEDVSKLNMYYPAALTYAQQLLARYCLTGRTIVFKTYRPGLDLLQIATVFFPEFNLVDAQLLITEIDIAVQTQPNNTVLYAYIVTATELPNIVSWSKLLGTLFLSGA